MSRNRQADIEDARLVAVNIRRLCDEKYGGVYTQFAAAVGVTDTTVRRWTLPTEHKDATTPNLTDAKKIRAAAAVTLDSLVSDTGPAKNVESVIVHADKMLTDIRQILDKILLDFRDAMLATAADSETTVGQRADRHHFS